MNLKIILSFAMLAYVLFVLVMVSSVIYSWGWRKVVTKRALEAMQQTDATDAVDSDSETLVTGAVAILLNGIRSDLKDVLSSLKSKERRRIKNMEITVYVGIFLLLLYSA